MKRLLFLLLFALLSACEKPHIQSYTVPHEIEKTPLIPESPRENNHIQVEWSAPVRWVSQPATAFRKGSYLVEGKGGLKAEVSVISFPGDAGGLAANVNRWRNQINLPPLEGDSLSKTLKKIKVSDQEIVFVEISNTTPSGKMRILGGVLLLHDESWFFKMSGADELVSMEKKAFLDLLSSVKVHHSH